MHRMTPGSLTDGDRRILLSIQDRLLWLAVNAIHYANSRRQTEG